MSYIDLDIRSKLHITVKGHRRGVVCVLWMLLVTYDSDTTDYDSFDYESDLEAEAPICLDFLVGAVTKNIVTTRKYVT